MALIPSCALCLAVCDAQSFLTSCEHFFCGRCVRRLQHPALRSFTGNSDNVEDKTGLHFGTFGTVDSGGTQGGSEKLPPPICPICKARGYQLLPITHKNLRPLFEDTSAVMEQNQRVVSAQLRHYRQIHRRMTDAFKVLNTNYRALEKKMKTLQQELKDTKETLRTLQQYAEKQKKEIEVLSSSKVSSDSARALSGDYFSCSSQGNGQRLRQSGPPPQAPSTASSTRYCPSGEERQYRSSSWENTEVWDCQSGAQRVHAAPPSPHLPVHMSSQYAHRYPHPYRSHQQASKTPPSSPLPSSSTLSSPPPLGWAATSSTSKGSKRSREAENDSLSSRGNYDREGVPPQPLSRTENSSGDECYRVGHSSHSGVTECGGRIPSSSLSKEREYRDDRISSGYPTHSPSPIQTTCTTNTSTNTSSSHDAARVMSSNRNSSGAGGALSSPYRHRDGHGVNQKGFVSGMSSRSPPWRSTASPVPQCPTGPSSRMLSSPMTDQMIPIRRLRSQPGSGRH